MNYRIVNGSVSYGADTILEEINFEIKNKEKIAIVKVSKFKIFTSLFLLQKIEREERKL